MRWALKSHDMVSADQSIEWKQLILNTYHCKLAKRIELRLDYEKWHVVKTSKTQSFDSNDSVTSL